MSSVIEWLLESDPSIRWQVMRDLMAEPAEVVAAERSRIASEGSLRAIRVLSWYHQA